ncbi:MAG: hypothetical protein M3Z06_01080 [Actinomycetota bacterium]|nr:hypothetical protein [Actinomycetota bacterium]
MRATRAYIAGFGTAGSLLAGAAIVFFFASAVVSFRGWPQVGAQATPVAVLAGPARPSSSHTQVRQFVALASVQTASSTRQAATGAGTGPAGGRLASGQPVTAILAAPPPGSHGGHHPSFTSTPPASPGAAPPPTTTPCSNCGAPTLGATLGAATQAVTGTLGATVANTGSRLGSVVSGLTGAVASKLRGLSPGLEQIVNGTGRGLDGTIGSATGNLQGTLSGVGNGLNGILTRHQ